MPSIRPSPRAKVRRRKATRRTPAAPVGRVAASPRRISGQARLDFFGPGSARFSPPPFFAFGRGRVVIKTASFLSHNAATDKLFERTQLALVFRRDKTDRITHRMGATRS